MSLIAKARGVERGFPTFVFDIFTQYAEGGPDYIYSLLTGYDEQPPAGMEIAEGTHYNPYFIAASRWRWRSRCRTTRSPMTTVRRRRSTSMPATYRPS